MAFYILFITIIYLLSKSRKTALYGFVVIWIISVIRFDIGFDYYSYYQLSIEQSDRLFDHLFSSIEPLSQAIFSLAKRLNMPYITFFIFSTIITYLIFDTIKRYSNYIPLSILAYIAFFFINDLSILRQAAAVALTFWGYRYIKERSLIKYLLVCIVAMGFHISAFIAIPIYFVCLQKKSTLSIIGMIVFALSYQIIWNYVEVGAHYLVREDLTGGNKILILNFVIFFYMMINDILSKNFHNNEYLYRIIMFTLLFGVLMGPHLGLRFGGYNGIYICLLAGNYKPYNLMNKAIMRSLLIAMFLGTIYTTTTHTKAYVPYRTIFGSEAQKGVFRIYNE